MISVNQVQQANALASEVESHKRIAIRLINKANDHNTANYSNFDKQINNRLVDGLSLNSKMIKRVLDLAAIYKPIPKSKVDLIVKSLSTDQPPFYNNFGQAFK